MQQSNLSPKCPERAPGPRLLIVDDEADALDLYRALLARIEPAPHVLSGSSGEEALRTWEREKFAGRSIDLVISDLYFGSPSLTGLTLVDELHRAGYKGKTALLTGDADAADLPTSMFHIDAVWTKPYDAMRLDELVIDLLGLLPMSEKPKAQPVTWKTKSPTLDYVTLCLIMLLIAVTVFNLWRSAYVVGMIQEVNSYVLKQPRAGKGVALEFRIPEGKSFVPPPLRDGSQDVTFRFAPEHAAQAREMAERRGVKRSLEVR